MKLRKKIAVFVTACVIATGLSIALDIQNAFAWATDQSATTLCDKAGNAVLEAVFNNTEPADRTDLNMDVTPYVSGQQIGETKTVKGGQGTFWNYSFGPEGVMPGNVTFQLVWTDGHSGYDERFAHFNGTEGPCGQHGVAPIVKASMACTVVNDAATFSLAISVEGNYQVVQLDGKPIDLSNAKGLWSTTVNVVNKEHHIIVRWLDGDFGGKVINLTVNAVADCTPVVTTTPVPTTTVVVTSAPPEQPVIKITTQVVFKFTE